MIFDNDEFKLEYNTPEKKLGYLLRTARSELNVSQQRLALLINNDSSFAFSQTKISHGERTGKVMATEFMAWVRVLCKLYAERGVKRALKDFEV